MPLVEPDWGALSEHQIAGMRRGVEKESLRVRAEGGLALTPHPNALGSALTHPHITTDFSESQLELITGVHATVENCVGELLQIQQVADWALDGEMLWVSSMPCELPADGEIPIGRYGTSNTGRLKGVYREGLGHRYGRRMQTISGIHYNWSLPGVSSADYFALIRNFRRHAFLLLYLFGASPAVDASFVAAGSHPLQPLGAQTLGLPHATTLRMGRLGYQSQAQASLGVSYNSLEAYTHALQQAMAQPYPAYEAIGLRGPDGSFLQLATGVLQIENEFYATIRPKRSVAPGQRPIQALRQLGVEYVEVRLMDLDPFEQAGIGAQAMRFLDVFLLHCLLTDSPADTPDECAALARNQLLVAERGREPGLELERAGDRIRLVDWGLTLVEHLGPMAQRLDAQYGGQGYGDAVQAARAALLYPQRTPSARVLHAMENSQGGDFVAFARAQSLLTQQDMRSHRPQPDVLARFDGLARRSWEEQARIERGDALSFEQYMQRFLSLGAE